jgi:outer membrane protein OmpA-like peptidoglycan-associated protein
MKNFFVGGSILLFFCLQGQLAYSQHAKEMAPGYYVVVASFSPDRENLAKNFTDGLKKKGLPASYGYNSERNYFYVYKNFYGKRQPSIVEMQETRKQEEFAKTWVRKVSAYNPGATVPVKPSDPEVTQTAPVTQSKTEVAVSAPVVNPADTIVVTDNAEIVQYPHMDLENTEVFLSLFNGQNNRVVEGSVKVIDTEKAKLLKEMKGNDYLYLPNPQSVTGELTLICEAFGYRKVQQEINYPMPMADTAKSYVDLMGTTFIVNFDLVRYTKGDLATLYQVFFYNDAALMLPESKYELNSLLDMMKENPKYRIRLHGHTNGNYTGKIMVMGENKNFFSLDGSKRTVGSAKELSRERAEVIKQYLVANGIDANRVEVKAWGGKRPIFDKNSANAKKNVRVEVEILDQ